MALETLPEDVKSRLRGGLTITSITQCVIELILNALDSKATAIAVQINFRTFRIQVVDNGDGISKANLNLVASQYTTNKCHSLKDYERNIKYHGYRGESLASMKEICSKLSITSRESDSDETYLRIFDGKVSNKANIVKYRPSEGTTVTLENVFFNLPVRQNRINAELDFETVKQFLDALSIIYPNVCFSLRNDATTKILFKNKKYDTVVDSIISYCPQVPKDSFVKIRLSKHKIRISGIISKEMYPNRKLQYFYINKRPIHCQTLQKLINNSLKSIQRGNSIKQDIFPIYALNIKCPYADVDLSFESNNYVASFVQFDVIKGFIGNIVETLHSKEKIEKANVNPNLKSEKLCKLRGCNIGKQNDVIDLKEKDHEVNSDEELINQRIGLELDDEKGTLSVSKDVDTSPKKIDISLIFKRKLDNERCIQNSNSINKDMLLKSYNEKERRNRKNTIVYMTEDEVEQIDDDLATPQLIATTNVEVLNENINDIPQKILSNDHGEQSGKLAIMKRFLKSTQTYPKEKRDMTGYDKNKMVKSSAGIILNTTSIVHHQSTMFSIKQNVLDTSLVSQLLSQSNTKQKSLRNTKGLQTSMFNLGETNSKCVQTSFVANTTVHLNGKETGSTDKTRVYNINFNQLHLLGGKKLNLNLKINKNNVDINFDLNRSKYFNNTIGRDSGNGESEIKQQDTRNEKEEMVPVSNGIKDNQLQRLNQSEYFIEESKFVDEPVNKLALIQDGFLSDLEGVQHQGDLRNNSVIKDVISETVMEEIDLESAKETTFYNMSNLPHEGQNFGESYFFHFKNTIPDDYRIWTDSSKIDFDSAQSRDIFKPSCSKDYSPKFESTLNDTEVLKKTLKRHLTEPVNLSRELLNDSKKRFKTFLSQDTSEHLEKRNKSKENLWLNKNDTIISSNLMKDFFNTSTNDNQKDLNKIDYHTDKEWYTQNNGQFFVHKRTGFSTYKCPAAAKFDFNLKKRNEDIPKGNSPIITRIDKCLFSLSQNTKDRLNAAIIKSYENELDTVKWGNFIKENDHKTFFTALFKTRDKNNPIKIPDISKKIIPKALVKMYNSEQSKNFVDDLFTNLEVIGQLDQKFILAFYKYNQLIFAFDQHAVHERIRLEQLQKSYLNEDATFKSNASNAIYKFNFTHTEINCLSQIRGRIHNLGLHFEIIDNNIMVDQIPTCLFNKFIKLPKSREKEADIILLALFEEILTNLKNTRGSLQVVPKVMQNILNSEACRGAIKFGESLNVEDCQNLLNDLGKCNLPFQCAHGRPTLIPLIELTDNYHTLLEM